MKYKIFFTAFIVIFMIGSIYAQDSIINEIAQGGKFIVRDDAQNESMVIEDGNVGFSGTLKLGVLPQGAISNSIVVWDPDDKLLKLQDQTAGGSTLWTESGSDLYRTGGNIGIGTANPSVKLDVAGQVKISGGTPGLGKVLTSDAAGLATWQTLATGGGSTLWTESGSNVYRTSGNIGIGTSNPSVKLDVAGQVKISGGIPGLGKVLTSDAAGLASWQTFATGGGSTLWTESGSNIYRNAGRVGIGTSNPTYDLEVNGTASAKRYVVKGINEITNGVWDLTQGNLVQITFNSSITPITINSDGSAGTYILIVKKNTNCTDCTLTFLGATVKYPDGVIPTLSSGSNTTDIFSFIAVGNNTFYCLSAKNLL